MFRKREGDHVGNPGAAPRFVIREAVGSSFHRQESRPGSGLTAGILRMITVSVPGRIAKLPKKPPTGAEDDSFPTDGEISDFRVPRLHQ